jgi:phosphoribosylglycinamide formyltransferase-1
MTPDPINRRLGILISGRGSNLQAIIDAIAEHRLDARIAVVISNVENAGGLERARRAGIETLTVSHRGWSSRDDYDRALVTEMRKRDVGLVCLAGFMRKIGRPLIDAYPDAILNIHPSLLPSFAGLHPQRQAIDHGVKTTGVTVHFVTEDLDAGPIIVQRSVPVHDDDTEDSLAARILVEEHHAYPEAIAVILSGKWTIQGRRVIRSTSASAV